jgi:hypothetical protein
MLAALADLDRMTAVGVVARAAVAMGDEDNPAASFVLPHEMNRRQALLSEIRRKLGIDSADTSIESIDRLGDALESEIDDLVGPTDEEAALEGLAARGDLPSDLFETVVIQNIADFHGRRFAREKELIVDTVRNAEQEQHFGEPQKPSDPFLISLFSKRFPDRFPLRSFTMLVAGQRNGTVLVVHEAWRIYGDLVDIGAASDLVDLLRRFSDVFGAEIEVNDRRGHFFLSESIKGPLEFSIHMAPSEIDAGDSKRAKKQVQKKISWSYFVQNDPVQDGRRASLVMATDLMKYQGVLESRGW